MMNIFFFGSTSFAAQDLINYLEKNYNTFFFSRKIIKRKNYFYYDLNKKNRDISKITRIKKIDYLFFFSSLVPLNEKNSCWEKCKQTNIYGLLELLLNLKLKVNKIVLASSCSLYGQEKKLIKNEESFLKPDTGYSLSKFTQEKFLKIYCDQNKIKFLSYRLGYVYGNKMNNNRLVKKLLLKHRNNKKISIYNKNLNLNLIHTKDISHLIAKSFKKAEGVYNLTNKKLITLDQFYKILVGKKFAPHNKNNNFSSKKFFNNFSNLKIKNLKERIKDFKYGN